MRRKLRRWVRHNTLAINYTYLWMVQAGQEGYAAPRRDRHTLWIRVPDPWFFYMDPDPRIRITGLRIRIMLFSSVAFKMLSTQVLLLITHRSPYRYTPTCHLYRKSFFLFFASWWKDPEPIRTNNYGSRSVRPINLQIRIRQTGFAWYFKPSVTCPIALEGG